jgi:hypothetical protein
MQLRQLQQELQRHLLGESSAIAAAIVDAPPLPADARLGIYRHAYRARLTDALDETYSVLHRVLGDEAYSELAGMFISARPSEYRSIRWYGRELADFLAEHMPFAEQPILSEIARFEWTLAEVFDSPDAQAIGRAALAAVEPNAWAELRLRFHPSLRRLQLAWNTVPVWQAMSADEEPPQPEAAPLPVQWLLWRQDFRNYFRSMEPVENAALDAALRGGSFAEICACLTALVPEDEIPLRAATLVGTWTDSGIIVGIG